MAYTTTSLSQRASDLNRLVRSPRTEIMMEAHNGLSSRIVESVGFKAIWASGLSIASSLGVRDTNEASWTQCLDVLEWMTDASTLPVLFDGDTGFGNFNNVRRLVSKLEQRTVAGVVLEDKVFPKMNSFVGNAHPLADAKEFSGKIRAAVDHRRCDEFQVIARTEAFISGLGLREALDRAETYRQAGANAIFVHSRRTDASEILAFAKEWAGRLPLVVAPTTYFRTPLSHLEAAGVSIFICANHCLRASIMAIQDVGRRVLAERGLVSAEEMIAPIDEVFRLLNYEELARAETKYLP